MLIPMFGFVLTLIVVGGLASLVAVGDPRYARLAPFVGFVALFAGLGALFLSLVLAWLAGLLFRSESVAFAGLLVGYVAGGLGGAAFGLKRAFGRRRKVETGAAGDAGR